MAFEILNTGQSSQKIFLESDLCSVNISPTSKTFDFLNPIKANSGNNISLKVIDFEIPVSWYTVNQLNNKIVVDGVTYTLVSQNYNAYELSQALTILLPNITVTFQTQSSKFLFVGTSPFILGASSCHKLIGMDFVVYNSTASLLSTNVVDLAGEKNLYIELSIANASITNYGDSHIVCKIPISVGSMELLCYDNVTDVSLLLVDKTIKKLNVSLIDHKGNPFQNNELNGIDWSLTIGVDFIQSRAINDSLNRNISQDEKLNQIQENMLNDI